MKTSTKNYKGQLVNVNYSVVLNEKYNDYRVQAHINGEFINEWDGNYSKYKANKRMAELAAR